MSLGTPRKPRTARWLEAKDAKLWTAWTLSLHLFPELHGCCVWAFLAVSSFELKHPVRYRLESRTPALAPRLPAARCTSSGLCTCGTRPCVLSQSGIAAPNTFPPLRSRRTTRSRCRHFSNWWIWKRLLSLDECEKIECHSRLALS